MASRMLNLRVAISAPPGTDSTSDSSPTLRASEAGPGPRADSTRKNCPCPSTWKLALHSSDELATPEPHEIPPDVRWSRQDEQNVRGPVAVAWLMTQRPPRSFLLPRQQRIG